MNLDKTKIESIKKELVEQTRQKRKRNSDFDSKLRKLCAYANISDGHSEWLLREIRGLRQPMHVIAKAKELGLI